MYLYVYIYICVAVVSTIAFAIAIAGSPIGELGPRRFFASGWLSHRSIGLLVLAVHRFGFAVLSLLAMCQQQLQIVKNGMRKGDVSKAKR